MIIADFTNCVEDTVTASGVLYQYDYNQKLKIQGLNIAGSAQVHFSFRQSFGEAVRIIGEAEDGDLTVQIPNFLLKGFLLRQGEYYIWAFVYVADSDAGETIKRIRIKVIARPRPKDYSEPEYKDVFDQITESLEAKVDKKQGTSNSGKFLAVGNDGNITLVDGNGGGSGGGGTVSVQVASTTTGEPGTDAKVTNSGDSQNVKLNFVIPRGNTGATPNIQIGTVETLEPGQDATATITGGPESPLLNLGIPKGEKGDTGSGGVGEPYELPIMSETQLGGGKAVEKTDEDVPVAVDPSTGQLFVPTYPKNAGGGSGGKSYYYEETLEEGIAKVFVPFSEFKGCKRIFAQIYIPDVSEESYNNYIPRAKIDNKDDWSSGKIFASRTMTANLNNVVIFGELVLNNSDAFFAGGGSRSQYTNQTVSGLNAATYGDKFTFNESETSGIYFEIYNRTNYSFPAGTKIIVVGM